MTDLRVRVGGRGRSGIMEDTPGWQDVTPATFNLNPAADNFGAMDVLYDPSRSGTFYMFTCYQGMWRSTDWGRSGTWAKYSANGSPLDGGKAYGAYIALDGSFILTVSGNNGSYLTDVLKSTNGGQTWTAYACGTDPYMLDGDPSDQNHIVGTSHNEDILIESFDGGQTWFDRGVIGTGLSSYVFFVNSTTLLAVAQEGSGGTSRLVWNGSSWGITDNVSTMEHSHGSGSIYVSGTNVWLPGSLSSGQSGKVEKSTNSGSSFTEVSNVRATNVIATGNYLYAGYSFPSTGTFNPNLQYAALPSGSSFSAITTPTGMTNGPKRWASAQMPNGQWILIGGHWLNGFWRYVEE